MASKSEQPNASAFFNAVLHSIITVLPAKRDHFHHETCPRLSPKVVLQIENLLPDADNSVDDVPQAGLHSRSRYRRATASRLLSSRSAAESSGDSSSQSCSPAVHRRKTHFRQIHPVLGQGAQEVAFTNHQRACRFGSTSD